MGQAMVELLKGAKSMERQAVVQYMALFVLTVSTLGGDSALAAEKSLAKLRTITIELDLNYGDLRAMQYHPDAGSS